MGFPSASVGKESAYNAGDVSSNPELGRSSGEGNGNPLQYPCLENSTDRGAWQATVHAVTKGQTQLSDFTSLHSLPHKRQSHNSTGTVSRVSARDMPRYKSPVLTKPQTMASP